MPAKQHGTIVKRGPGNWQARWRDEDGEQHGRSGFPTKTAARDWLTPKVNEVEALRRGEAIPQQNRPGTVNVLLDTFLDKHGATIDPATKTKLQQQLKHARATFGDLQPDVLKMLELEDWRATLPAGSRHDVFRAFRQALTWGAKRGLVTRNASDDISNPKRAREERRDINPFETWDEVRAVADELDPRYRPIPIVGVGCGLRPEEIFGLHRTDVDRGASVLRVRNRFTGGMFKEGGKTRGSVRTIPLRQVVLDALDEMPPRIDTPILFPAPRGGYIDLEKFRHREWTPAFRAAGVPHRPVKDMRHTFATWAIEAGIELSFLARIMGTSVRELEDTYFRWLTRTDDHIRATFDLYDTELRKADASDRANAQTSGTAPLP